MLMHIKFHTFQYSHTVGVFISYITFNSVYSRAFREDEDENEVEVARDA